MNYEENFINRLKFADDIDENEKEENKEEP